MRGYFLSFRLCLADVNDLCSNHWNLPFTPEELRNLAVPGTRCDSPSEAVSYRAHELSERLGTEKISEIVARANAGESARSLARELGVANSALTRMLRVEGVVIQKRNVSVADARALARAYEAGHTIRELEAKHDLSHGAILRALHRAGVEMRAKAPRRH